jgi:hypothetical protein
MVHKRQVKSRVTEELSDDNKNPTNGSNNADTKSIMTRVTPSGTVMNVSGIS